MTPSEEICKRLGIEWHEAVEDNGPKVKGVW